MKVIEDNCPFANVTMTKKRARTFVNNCDTSDEGSIATQGKCCSHLAKSLNFNSWKKNLGGKRRPLLVECSDCCKEEVTDCAAVWFCLQCGYQGCGRDTKSQHALNHSQQTRSDPHQIAVDLRSWNVWCYECDDWLSIHCNKRLEESVNFIRKRVDVVSPRGNGLDLKDDIRNTEPMNVCSTNTGVKSKLVATTQAPKLKGLSNLGNTCFFNAVMQSLSQVKEFSHLLNEMFSSDAVLNLPGYSRVTTADEDSEESEGDESSSPSADDSLEPLVIHLKKSTSSYPLIKSLTTLLRDMCSDSTPKQTLNPAPLFQQICSKSTRFRGFQQQDSHELLRNLLDHVKSEEIKRYQSGILNTFDYKSLDTHARKQVESTIKLYGQQARYTTVDSLFGGYLLSTVLCKECGKASQIFEPFLDLSLPVSEEKSKRGRARSTRSVSEDVEDLLATGSQKQGPSKYQQKKAKRKAKYNKKNSVSTSLDKDAPTTDPIPQDALPNPDNTDTTSTIPVQPITDKSRPHSPDSTSSSSGRADTPKSGYNSDMEDSERPLDAGGLNQTSLINSLEKLSIDEDKPLCKSSYSEQVSQAVKLSLTPLGTRQQQVGSHDFSVLSCLTQFTHPELLTGPNKFACSYCNRRNKKQQQSKDKSPTVYCSASKLLFIYSPPAILTLHLKRFQQCGYSFSKVQRHVAFTTSLDISPYCSKLSQGISSGQTCVKYLLFAVIEHSGRLSGGHYTAYIRNRSVSTVHKTMIQKSLSNHKPISVLLERMADLHAELASKDVDSAVESTTGPPDVSGSCSKASDDTETNSHSKWYHISDSHVREVSEKTVLDCQAYIIFYERVK